MAVVIFHFSISESVVNPLLRFGSAGVDLFFIISGFVISMSTDKSPTLVHFAVSRVSRLFPTYWTGVMISFGIIMLHQIFSAVPVPALENPGIALLANMTMVQYYLGVADIEPPYWTMIVEWLFYVLMGGLMFSRARRYVWIVSAVLCSIIGMASFAIESNYDVKAVFVLFPLLYHFPLFFLGMIFYRRFTIGRSNSFYYLIFLALICQCFVFPHTWRTCKYISAMEYLVVLAVFVLAFEGFCRQRLNFIVSPLTLFLGRISFPLYLTHQYLNINLIVPYMRWKFNMSLFGASAFVALPICILLAWLIHITAERIWSKRFKEYLTRKWIGNRVS